MPYIVSQASADDPDLATCNLPIWRQYDIKTGSTGNNGNHSNGSGGSGGSGGSSGGAAGKYIRGLSNVTLTQNGTVQGGTA